MKTHTKPIFDSNLDNKWKTGKSGYTNNYLNLKATGAACGCIRWGFSEKDIDSKQVLTAYAYCENCSGFGIPPIPWSELR